jgi:hypothetical protein
VQLSKLHRETSTSPSSTLHVLETRLSQSPERTTTLLWDLEPCLSAAAKDMVLYEVVSLP